MNKYFKAAISVLLILGLTFASVSCDKSTKNKSKKKRESKKHERIEVESTPSETEIPETTSENTITIGTNAYFPPYEYFDDGRMLGIDLDIMNEIAFRLNLNPVWIGTDFEDLFMLLEQGEFDVVIAGVTATEDRLAQADFTISYFTNVQVCVVRQDSYFTSVDEVMDSSEHLSFGAKEGTTASMYLEDDLYPKTVNVFSTYDDAISYLDNGLIDVVIMDEAIANEYIDSYSNLRILATPYCEEDYCIAVKKGNTELLDSLNEVIEDMINDGSIDRIAYSYIE